MEFEPLFQIIFYIGICSLSVSGAIVAIDKECDLFGVVFLSVITTFGGGLIRDFCLGLEPPLMFRKDDIFGTPIYFSFALCILASVGVFLFAAMKKEIFLRYEKTVGKVNNIVDALGLGAFSVYGTAVSLSYSQENELFGEPVLAILMGLTTAIFGGVIRDVCLKQYPFVLHKRVYAVAALLGATVYYVLTSLGADQSISSAAGVLSTFGLRVCATIFNWNIPVAIRFSKLPKSSDDDKRKETLFTKN